MSCLQPLTFINFTHGELSEYDYSSLWVKNICLGKLYTHTFSTTGRVLASSFWWYQWSRCQLTIGYRITWSSHTHLNYAHSRWLDRNGVLRFWSLWWRRYFLTFLWFLLLLLICWWFLNNSTCDKHVHIFIQYVTGPAKTNQVGTQNSSMFFNFVMS